MLPETEMLVSVIDNTPVELITKAEEEEMLATDITQDETSTVPVVR